jgi:hypothetical protein
MDKAGNADGWRIGPRKEGGTYKEEIISVFHNLKWLLETFHPPRVFSPELEPILNP